MHESFVIIAMVCTAVCASLFSIPFAMGESFGVSVCFLLNSKNVNNLKQNEIDQTLIKK